MDKKIFNVLYCHIDYCYGWGARYMYKAIDVACSEVQIQEAHRAGTMKIRSIVAILVLVIASGAFISAQGGTVRFVPARPRMVRLLEPLKPQGRGDTKIVGKIIDMRRSPVVSAHVQLRDLSNGHIVQDSLSGQQGEYEFTVSEAGTYVVEMVGGVGQVIALSNAGSLMLFQTMNTFIQVPGRWDVSHDTLIPQRSMTSFFGMSTQNTMTAATLLAATNFNVAPAAAGEPVSP